jgi:tetratricopeptide (TPR) repeat protein
LFSNQAARVLALFLFAAAVVAHTAGPQTVEAEGAAITQDAGASRDSAAFNNEGSQLLQSGQAEAALEKFRQAAELNPDDPAIRFNVGLALFRLERYQEALPALEKSLGHAVSEPNARFLRGVIYYQFSEFELCAAELEKVRQHARFGEPALYRLVEAYRRTGRVEPSQQAFAELNSRYPDSPFVHQLMGIAYDSMHQPADAIREFEAALEANPRLPEAAFGAGYVHFKEGNLDKAAEWLAKELQLDPCHAAAHRYLGEIALKQARFGEAAGRFEQSSECDPREPGTYLGWGAAVERLDQLERAWELYRKAAELDPDSSDVHYRLGRVLQRLGHTQEAQAAFERVKELRARYSEQAARDMETAKAKEQ